MSPASIRGSVTVLSVVVALAVAATAGAASTPRYGTGTTDCSYVGFGGQQVGLATDMPRMYAIDYRRGVRDTQRVKVRTDLLYHDGRAGSPWTRMVVGDWFTGLAADNNPAQVFHNDRTGQAQGRHQRLQFFFSQSGGYRVEQYLRWLPKGRMPSYSINRGLYHYPGYSEGRFCFFP